MIERLPTIGNGLFDFISQIAGLGCGGGREGGIENKVLANDIHGSLRCWPQLETSDARKDGADC